MPAILNEYVHPVALPTNCASTGTMCSVHGWGNTMSSNDGTRLQGNRLKMKNLFLVISLISIDQSRWIYQLLMNHIVMMLTENCSQRIQFVLASLKVEKTHAMETKVDHLFAMVKCRVLLAWAMVVPSQ